MKKNYFYFPLELPFILMLIILFLLLYPLFILIFAGGIVEAFARLGFSPVVGTLLFLISILGSAINIPLFEMKSKNYAFVERVVYFYGVAYKIPQYEEEKTLVTINLGGAIVPIIISIYEFFRLLTTSNIYPAIASIIGIIVVSIVIHLFAKPVKGVGIAVPFFIPPIITVIVALLLSRQYTPSIAYISGTIGTLIGADLLNLKRINELEAPVVSIGGAGTFDGIFLTGIISTLLT